LSVPPYLNSKSPSELSNHRKKAEAGANPTNPQRRVLFIPPPTRLIT
jgi:hypothetical protein